MPYSVFSAGFYLIVNVRSSIFVDGGYGKNKDVIFYNFLVDARVDVDYGVLSLTERANMKSDKLDLIIPALVKMQGSLEHAKKDVENTFFKSRYADLAAVLDACKVHLKDNGLAVTHQRESLDTGEYLITTLWHTSGQFLSSRSKLMPSKSDPQGFGSAQTYSRRYDLSALIGLASEDDDANAASAPVKKESLASRNKRYDALKAELSISDDPAVTWGDYKEDIAVFRADMGEEFYTQLVEVAKKRKDELTQMESMREQLGVIK